MCLQAHDRGSARVAQWRTFASIPRMKGCADRGHCLCARNSMQELSGARGACRDSMRREVVQALREAWGVCRRSVEIIQAFSVHSC